MDKCEDCGAETPCDPCKMNAWKQLHCCAWCDRERLNMISLMGFVFCVGPNCKYFFFERYPHLWRGG